MKIEFFSTLFVANCSYTDTQILYGGVMVYSVSDELGVKGEDNE